MGADSRNRRRPLHLALLLVLLLVLCSLLVGAPVSHAAKPAADTSCDWNNPGSNRYTGTVEAAVQRHQRAGLLTADEARQILAERAAGRRLVLTITRDAISGPGGTYAPQLAGMHFGQASMCTGPADRSGWPVKLAMASITHCASTGACVTCPAACTNCSVVRRTPAPGQGLGTLAPALPIDQVGAMRGPLPLGDEPLSMPMPMPSIGPLVAPQAITLYPSDVVAPPAVRTFNDGAGISMAAPPPAALPALPTPPLVFVLPAPVPAVPEPETAWLLAAGVGMVLHLARRRAHAGRKHAHQDAYQKARHAA